MASAIVLDQSLEFLCAAFDKRIDEARRLIYTNLLADLPDDLLKAAVKHCAATNTFFPVPGEIRSAAAHLGRLSCRVPSADEAWSELVNRAHAPRQSLQVCQTCAQLEQDNQRLTAAIQAAAWARDHAKHDELLAELNQVMRQQHARRACPDCQTLTHEYQFSHPLVKETAERLGWPGRFWSDNVGVDRGRFIKTYEALLERQTGEALLIPPVREYIQSERLLADDRHAALESGERAEVHAQYRRLARSLK